jgi:hypothetical protein
MGWLWRFHQRQRLHGNGCECEDACGTFKLGSTDGSAGFWNGNISRLTFYSTKNQIALNGAAKKFVMVGDSIPAGFNSNQPFPQLIARDLNTVVSNQSVAGAGWTTDPGGGSLTARAAAAVDPLVAYNGSAATTKLGLFAGTNDIFTSGLTGAQTFAAFETYIQARNAVGYLYANMIVFEMLPRAGAHEVERTDYNAALVAGALTYGYQLVRLSLDTLIGVAGADSNRAYYGFDKTHPTDWSQNRIKSLGEALFAA